MIGTYVSKPYKIRAFKISDMRFTPPKWFLDAYHAGIASVTCNATDSYVVIYSKDGNRKAFIGDWVCINDNGVIFPMTDRELRDNFIEIQQNCNTGSK